MGRLQSEFSAIQRQRQAHHPLKSNINLKPTALENNYSYYFITSIIILSYIQVQSTHGQYAGALTKV